MTLKEWNKLTPLQKALIEKPSTSLPGRMLLLKELALAGMVDAKTAKAILGLK